MTDFLAIVMETSAWENKLNRCIAMFGITITEPFVVHYYK